MRDDDIAIAGETVFLRRPDDRWTPAEPHEAAAILARLVGQGRTMPPPPPATFVTAVEAYLEKEVGRPHYELMRHTFIDVARFEQWVRVMCLHRDPRGLDVLVSGCQSGGSLVAWWAGGARSVHGLDIDHSLIELANHRISGLDNVTAAFYEGRDVPAPDHSYDMIESIDVLEHVPWPQAYIAELGRVLRPGGVILLTTPNRLFPIEQHVHLWGAPWLSIERADGLYPKLAECRTRLISEDLRWRLSVLPEIRATNVSFRFLRSLATRNGLRLEMLDREQHGGDWPFPPDARVIERLSRHRLGKFVAPTRHHTVLLHKPA